MMLRPPALARPSFEAIFTLAAVALLACAHVVTAAAAVSPKTAVAHSNRLPNRSTKIEKFWARRISGYLRARDGVSLHYSVLLPAKSGRFPVALIYSGYDTGSIGGVAYLHGNTTFSRGLDRTLVRHGYAVMGLNARATGCSGGAGFTMIGGKWGEDGRDAIEFAARQAWSTGNVGMYGWSWGGSAQVGTAPERPPHLKAVAPGMVEGGEVVVTAPGGVSQFFEASEWVKGVRTRWEATKESAEAEHDAQCAGNVKRNMEGLDEAFNGPQHNAWLKRPQLDWAARRISVPVLLVQTFQDNMVTSGLGFYQEVLNPGRTWVLQSNGPHDLYVSLRFRKVLLAFFDHFLKGVPNGFETRPHLTVWMDTHTSGTDFESYMEGEAPRWQFGAQRILPTVKPVSFFLTQGGTLVAEGRGRGKPDEYTYPVQGPAVNVAVMAPHPRAVWGPLPVDWRKGSVVYTSAPLPRDTLTYGPATAYLWLSSSAIDTDLQVTLTEVRPDGEEMYLQRGWLRLSYRAVNEAQSTALATFLSYTQSAQSPHGDDPVLARVPLTEFAALLRKGSRIRIWIDAPSPTGTFGFDDLSLPATNEVWHDREHPSRLMIGELDPSKISVPPDEATCGASVLEPCRQDPLAK